MRHAICLSLATALVTTLGTPSIAAKKAGVTMPDAITVGDTRLTLNGMGLREASFLKVDVYVVGLYVQTPSPDPTQLILSNQTKRLVLRFVRNVDREDIVKALSEGFKNNATVPIAQLQSQIATLESWTQGFKKGDTLTFTYVPGQGVQVDINNVPKGVIPGEEFAHSLFAIWLGARPPTGDVKAGLLGRR
jgi:hypothetical protein